MTEGCKTNLQFLMSYCSKKVSKSWLHKRGGPIKFGGQGYWDPSDILTEFWLLLIFWIIFVSSPSSV